MDFTSTNRSIIFVLCFYCLNLINLFSSTQYIIVTEYEENNYCHSITFKNIVSKLKNKDNSNFYIILKNIDDFDLKYLKKDYKDINFILDNKDFNLGEFYIINDKDTNVNNITLNCEERFEPTILDSVIEKLNNKFELIKIEEKIPIFQIPIFPEESISVSDSLLLFLDKRNVIHEINFYTGELLFQYEINDSICDELINKNKKNAYYLDMYFSEGYKFSPQNCLFINNRKHLRYVSTYDIEFQFIPNDTIIIPLQKFVLTKFDNNNLRNIVIEKYPNSSSYINFNLSKDTLINIGFLDGLEILYLDTNFSLTKSKKIDTTYKFANYLSATQIENGLLMFFNNSILSFNFKTQKTNKLLLDSMILSDINPIKPFMYNNMLNFFYISKDNKKYGIFDYKNNKTLTVINEYFDEEIKEIRLINQEKNILFFLVKFDKSRWNIFKLHL